MAVKLKATTLKDGSEFGYSKDLGGCLVVETDVGVISISFPNGLVETRTYLEDGTVIYRTMLVDGSMEIKTF